MNRPTILERAFELAASAECRDLEEVRRRLKREGYLQVDAHLAAKSVQAQLKSLYSRDRSKD